MVTVQQAEQIILSKCFTPGTITIPLAQAVGKVLAEEVLADRDFPPFNRVAMDGIAILFDRYTSGQREFKIEGVQAAGETIKKLADQQHCFEVMTGAVLPSGTDTVIRYEDVTIDLGKAHIDINTVSRGQHIHRQGQDARKSEVLLEANTLISPAEVALLATVGHAQVKVLAYPKTAIIASGDELIPVEENPLPHQIRRSNTYAIEAGMRVMGWEGKQFHFPDNREILKDELTKVLADYDVIILSGGISKGKFDYIPEVLQECGIKTDFQHVSQRPGKPFWFGTSASGKIVFALPGNPVSTFMCFYKYIRPWFFKSLGVPEKKLVAVLAQDFSFEPKLTCFLQAKLEQEGGRLMAYPNVGGGSGDFANLKDVNGFLELPFEKSSFKAGEVYPFIPFR